MTRILVLSNFYPPHAHGGYEMSCADVMRRLAGRGHEVTVLTSCYTRPGVADSVPGSPIPGSAVPGNVLRGNATDAAAERVTVRRELDLYWDDHRLVVPPRWRRARMELANQRRLRTALRTARPDVVSVWNMGAMSLGLLATLAARGVPVVYAVCNDWLVWGPEMDAWTHGWADRPVLGRLVQRATGLPTGPGNLGASGVFLFVSDFTRQWAERNSAWAFPDAGVVYSGIDPADFPVPTGPNTADPARPWRWRLLFVGRLEPDKGVDTAVAALAHLPAEATLEVIGPGSAEERRRVEDAARSAGVVDRVRYDDRARAALAERYRAADVFVFPSRWEEPFGLVPIEAMACATPVVATRTGGSAEVLADAVNCLGVPREDPAALAAAVRRLAGDPKLRAHLVGNGLATARELTVDRLADSFEGWLVGAAEGFPEGRPDPRGLPVLPARPAG